MLKLITMALGTLTMGSVMKRTKFSGWTVPLFDEGNLDQSPFWFALRFSEFGFTVHKLDGCPFLMDCRVSDDLGTADGITFGKPSASYLDPEEVFYRDVHGRIGIHPASSLMDKYAVYLSVADSIEGKIKLASHFDTIPGEIVFPLGLPSDCWSVEGALRYKGKNLDVWGHTRVNLRLEADTIGIHSLHLFGVLAWRSVFKNDRLFLPCSMFDGGKRTVFEIKLRMKSQSIQVPVMLSEIEIHGSRPDLCPTNLKLINRGDPTYIGFTVLHHYDLVLDARKRVVRFIPKGAVPVDVRPVLSAPKLNTFRVGKAIFDGVSHRVEWIPVSGPLRASDVVFTHVPLERSQVLKLVMSCVFTTCVDVFPGAIGDQWRGTPRFELTSDGRLVMTEEHEWVARKMTIKTKCSSVSLLFEGYGRRFRVDPSTFIRSRRIEMIPVSDPQIRKDEFVVTSWPPVPGDLRTNVLTLTTDNPDSILPLHMHFWHGSPVLKVDTDIRLIITSEDPSGETNYHFSLSGTDKKYTLYFYGLFKMFRRTHDREKLEFEQTESDGDFAAGGSTAIPRVQGSRGLYWITFQNIPGERADPNKVFDLKGKPWVGKPKLQVDWASKKIAVVTDEESDKSYPDLEYHLNAQLDDSLTSVTLFFSAETYRFRIPLDTPLGGPLWDFAPVTGPKVPGEFSLFKSDFSFIRTTSNGDEFSIHLWRTAPHSWGPKDGPVSSMFGEHTGWWNGEPEAFISDRGHLIIQSKPGTSDLFKVEEEALGPAGFRVTFRRFSQTMWNEIGAEKETVDQNPLGEECPICLNKFEPEQTIALTKNCKHRFHPVCLLNWKNSGTRSCPCCRAPLS
jgi:hypothetical protein